MAKVSVIGAGSWGTALALLLYKNGHDVTVWSYQEEEVRMLSEKREHVSKLPGVKIPEGIFYRGYKRGSRRKGCSCTCSTVNPCKKYRKKDQSICKRWTDLSGCSKRNRRRYADDSVSAN